MPRRFRTMCTSIEIGQSNLPRFELKSLRRPSVSFETNHPTKITKEKVERTQKHGLSLKESIRIIVKRYCREQQEDIVVLIQRRYITGQSWRTTSRLPMKSRFPSTRSGIQTSPKSRRKNVKPNTLKLLVLDDKSKPGFEAISKAETRTAVPRISYVISVESRDIPSPIVHRKKETTRIYKLECCAINVGQPSMP